MAIVRQTLTQTAQANIKRQLLEGNQAQFFRGMGNAIIAADPGELAAMLAETIAGISLGIIIEVVGGPTPHYDIEDANAEITIFENPVINRAQGSNGKTADVVLDAVLLAFADGGAFWPKSFDMLPGDERVGWVVRGTTPIALVPTDNPGKAC